MTPFLTRVPKSVKMALFSKNVIFGILGHFCDFFHFLEIWCRFFFKCLMSIFDFFQNCHFFQKCQKRPFLGVSKGAPLLILSIFGDFWHLSDPKIPVFFTFFYVFQLPLITRSDRALSLMEMTFLENAQKNLHFLKVHILSFLTILADFGSFLDPLILGSFLMWNLTGAI